MALVLFIGFITLILLRVPISMAIGAAVLCAFAVSEFSNALYIVPQQVLEGVNKPSLAAVPFFIMAGNLMNVVGMTDRIFRFASSLVGHFRAGLAQVNVLSSMIYAACPVLRWRTRPGSAPSRSRRCESAATDRNLRLR